MNLICRPPLRLLLPYLNHRCFLHSETPLQHSIRTAIETNHHHQIPHLLLLLSHSSTNPNPFSFLCFLPPTLTARIVDDLLQSLISLRPRTLSHPTYASLLQSLTLLNPNPNPSLFLPLTLAVLQSSIRSGFHIPPQTRLSLSLSWLHLRRRRSAYHILSSMRHLGYRPDLNTCNFLISSLAASSDPDEAVVVLRGMPGAGLLPDSESYCAAIEAVIGTAVAEELVREMVEGMGMTPRKGTVGRVVRGMDVRRAAELVRFLEREGCRVGFESYEFVVEGCLKKGELVLAGRVVAEMAARGFVPYIKVRQKVVEGLAGIGQCELASAVRQRLAELGS